MTFIERLLPEFHAEMANTRKIPEAVPEDQFAWKQHDKSMNLAHLAGHNVELPR